MTDKLARQSVLQFVPYSSAKSLGTTGSIWLDANEAPTASTYSLNSATLNRYGDCQPASLITAYANYCALLPEQVLACRGADEGIELLMKAFCQPGEASILDCAPTYDMYRASAEILGVHHKTVPLTPQWQLNLPVLLRELAQVKILFLCRPNNPTGNLIDRDDLITLLNASQNQTLIVVDEAYIEYCATESVTDLLALYPNLVILRTLSKAFALAGLRCGFILANPPIIALLRKVIAPYPIAIPVAEIATLALTPARCDIMQQHVAELTSIKQALITKLAQFTWIEAIYPSYANFILIRTAYHRALFTALLQQGIVIRNQDHALGLQGCLRISIGTAEECQTLVTVLADFAQRQGL